VPPVKVLSVRWQTNAEHATRRATREEVEEVFANGPIVRTNRRGRVATHLAIGRTDSGRPLTIAFIYVASAQAAYPISAWERR
jgi:hypothetical protein